MDHLAEERSLQAFAVWIQRLVRNSPDQLAINLAARHRAGTLITASLLANGAFNVCYQVAYQDGFRVLARFTALGQVKFPKEKVQDEVEIMKYLAQHTSIPVPKVLGSGMCRLGPYIVMTIIEGKLLSGHLRDQSDEAITLNPKIRN